MIDSLAAERSALAHFLDANEGRSGRSELIRRKAFRCATETNSPNARTPRLHTNRNVDQFNSPCAPDGLALATLRPLSLNYRCCRSSVSIRYFCRRFSYEYHYPSASVARQLQMSCANKAEREQCENPDRAR